MRKPSKNKHPATRRPLKVLFVSAEVAPFSFAGGLSQVSYFLPRALLKQGVDVRIFTPKYGNFNEKKTPLKTLVEHLDVPTGESVHGNHPLSLDCAIKTPAQRRSSDPYVYLLENQEYYGQRANVYGYQDDHVRFGLLSRAVTEFLKNGPFQPDVIHTNDWHTAYILNYLGHELREHPTLQKMATLLTVHNTYQGNFDFQQASEIDFDDGSSGLAPLFSDRFQKLNGLKRGAIHADAINTVSPTYAAELLSREHGTGLHLLFREIRSKLYGILNGLDYEDFNPRTDRVIKQNYSVRDISSRALNKADLQQHFGLAVSPETPVIAYSGRLDEQKGLDLLIKIIEFVLVEFNVQLVVLGKGNESYRNFFADLEERYPGRVGTHLQADFTLPRKFFAGADIMLMPSRYEPGGIVAIEAMRYGCVPVVRATGGLADMVEDFDPVAMTGSGFTFSSYSSQSLLVAIARALEVYKNQPLWTKLVKQAMSQDFSWDKTATEYQDLYTRTVEFRKEALKPNPSQAFKQKVR